MRLRYTGNGKYLNGVPASDHDTDDAVRIAVALDSGLYVIADAQTEPPVVPVEAHARRGKNVAVVTDSPTTTDGATEAPHEEAD